MLSEQIAALKRYDSATIFNAVALKLGLPNLDYTDHTIRCLLPDLGLVVGFAVTAEVTTNDDDSTALEWIDYYDYLDSQQGPLIAVFQDTDINPGRGASFGDGMARIHKRLGVEGVIVEGTVRDLIGIQQVGLPVWAWGTVPGHGVFNMTRFGRAGDRRPPADPFGRPAPGRRRRLCAHSHRTRRRRPAPGRRGAHARGRDLRFLRIGHLFLTGDAGAAVEMRSCP